MNGFVVTYGPEPKVWCTSCRTDTPLVARIDGTLRPGDVDRVEQSHIHGPPGSAWDGNQERRAS